MSNDTLQELHAYLKELAPKISHVLTTKEVNHLWKLHDRLYSIIQARTNVGGKIEIIHYQDRQLDPYTDMFYWTAREKFVEDGDFEVDEATMITESDDDGEYILGFKWIPNDDVVFPKRYEMEIGYEDEDGTFHYIAREAVLAHEQAVAEQVMHDKHWDSRLDSASCKPYYVRHPVAVDTYHAYLQDDEDDEEIEHHVDGVAAKEDLLHGLSILYGDLSEYHSVIISDSSGNDWKLVGGELVEHQE